METQIIVRDIVGAVPYWAADETLPQVRARFKRLTGRFPSKKASVIALTGTFEQIDAVTVNDMGDINYHKDVVKTVIQ